MYNVAEHGVKGKRCARRARVASVVSANMAERIPRSSSKAATVWHLANIHMRADAGDTPQVSSESARRRG